MSHPSASIEVAPSELSGSLCAVRLSSPEAHKQMERSLREQGQLTPVQAFRSGGALELFDGLKRWRAAQALEWPLLRVEIHALDAAGAKVGMLCCNAASALSPLEVAWVVRSLYRQDKLSQPQIAQMLGRGKSWVCRKLALAEGLSDELTAQVKLGLLCARAAQELSQLPRGNQENAAKVVIRRGLTTRQTARLVTQLLGAQESEWPRLLEESKGLSKVVKGKGNMPKRTPGELLVADSWAIKEKATRLHTRLLERSLSSLGASACEVVTRELGELSGVLQALNKTLDERLKAQGVANVIN